MVQSLFPGATRLPLGFDDTVDAVLAQIPAGTTHFLFHLNVSITTDLPACRDELIRALATRGIRTINGRATDISRPFIQRFCAAHALNVCLATRDLPDGTPVIVKSSLNHGGKTERDLPPSEVARLGLHLPPHGLGPANYKVVRAGAVPPAIWDDPSLSIERFISNDDGRYHRAYIWRDRLVMRDAINPALIKKTFDDVSSTMSRFTLIDGRYRPVGTDPGPQALLAQLAVLVPAYGLDFGTIDAMLDNEGRHYIVDVNTTPFYLTRSPEIEEHLGSAPL